MPNVTFTTRQLAAMPDLHKRISGWRLVAIDGTLLVPAMTVEHAGVIDLIPGHPEEGQSVELTVWPERGWMVGISLPTDPGSVPPANLEFQTR